VAKEAGVECEEVLMKGSWLQTILTAQRELKAGLLVLGGFTYSMTRHDLISKAKRLIMDEVACCVLVVK
jgi:hypothetical protein